MTLRLIARFITAILVSVAASSVARADELTSLIEDFNILRNGVRVGNYCGVSNNGGAVKDGVDADCKDHDRAYTSISQSQGKLGWMTYLRTDWTVDADARLEKGLRTRLTSSASTRNERAKAAVVLPLWYGFTGARVVVMAQARAFEQRVSVAEQAINAAKSASPKAKPAAIKTARIAVQNLRASESALRPLASMANAAASRLRAWFGRSA